MTNPEYQPLGRQIEGDWMQQQVEMLRIGRFATVTIDRTAIVTHRVHTLDGSVGVELALPANYPVAFELSGEPEPWTETVKRHTEDMKEGEQ